MVVVKLFRSLFGILFEINNSHKQSLNRVDSLCLAENLGGQQGKAAFAHNHIDRLSVALNGAAAKCAIVLNQDCVFALDGLSAFLGRSNLDSGAADLSKIIKQRLHSLVEP